MGRMQVKLCKLCTIYPPRKNRSLCNDCLAAYQRRLYHKAHDKNRLKQRVRGWKRRGINITLEEYERKFELQEGLCLICKKAPVKEALHVDHRHSDGQVRDLLCRRCNACIGVLEDPLFPAYQAYLENWRKRDK